jgi:F-box protein 11
VVVEGCDLTSANGEMVSITGKDSAPVFHDCEIRDESDRGVLFSDQGQGTIEKCVISGNAYSGVQIRTGNPTMRDCQIRDNKEAGVYVYEQGQGILTGNTLTGNPSSEWVIRANAERVTGTGNRPNA